MQYTGAFEKDKLKFSNSMKAAVQSLENVKNGLDNPRWPDLLNNFDLAIQNVIKMYGITNSLAQETVDPYLLSANPQDITLFLESKLPPEKTTMDKSLENSLIERNEAYKDNFQLVEKEVDDRKKWAKDLLDYIKDIE
ncbi:hypothetical protein WA158_001695 [Blastocystis sp. Blastoise]